MLFRQHTWYVGCKNLGMSMLQRCQKYLKEHAIRYSHSIHAPADTARAVAVAECMPPHSLAKVVVYFGDNGYGMLVLPADCFVDFREVHRLLGLRGIRLAAESELIDMFRDCEPGAMPPFGNLFELPVLVDESIATAEFMAFNAGTHQDVIRMRVADFHDLVNPLVAAFAIKAPAATVP
jgi:Ala-tRNA(Pro) deacylase